MRKVDLLDSLSKCGGVDPTTAGVSKFLGVTSETVRTWPNVVTYKVLRGVCGDFVRLNKKIPQEIVLEMRRLYK